MRYTRIFAGAGGETHFEDVDVELSAVSYAPPAPPLLVAAPVPAERCILMTMPSGWFGDWHPTPQRQFFFQLAGEIETEVSDGEVRRFGPGSIQLLDDQGSKGHITRSVGEDDVRGVFVQLSG
jgi:hypothetical protein